MEVIKTNPKYFFSYVKNHSKTSRKIGPIVNDQGDYVYDPTAMADIFQKKFCSVFSKPESIHKKIPPSDSDLSSTKITPVCDISFTVKHIIEAITEIDISSASGEDGFSAILLKNCKDSLAHPLLLLWRKSLDNGVIHPIFTSQLISPVHKKGNKLNAENYRPIALTSNIVKIMERIIRNKLVDHLESNNLLHENQHGFHKGRSCLSELL